MATLKNLTINDTGFVQLAKGSTAQRPGTPTAGMIRYNTDYNRNELYTGTAWVLTDGSNYATGGTVTTVGGYRIHTFTTVGATAFTMTYPGTVEVMLVGGGGGGAGIGGGGGAGGFIYESQLQLTAGAYTVNVGGGGGGEPSHNSLAAPGSNSSIVGPALTNLTAIGGGRGLPYARNESPSPHGYGGSGGGGPGGAAAEIAMGFGMANQMINQGMLTGQTTPPAGGAPVQAAATPALLTPAQVAQQLGVSEADVLATLEAGDLKGKKIGTQWRITADALAAYLK